VSTVILSLDEARDLSVEILVCHQTSTENAISVSEALVAAEVDGQKGHGLSRLPSYAAQSASGKVDGQAVPQIVARAGAAVRVDAAGGFAFPALELANRELAVMAPGMGVVAAGIFHSHHFGQAGYHVEKLAEHGLIGLGQLARLFKHVPMLVADVAPRSRFAQELCDCVLAAHGPVSTPCGRLRSRFLFGVRSETLPDDAQRLSVQGWPLQKPEAGLELRTK